MRTPTTDHARAVGVLVALTFVWASTFVVVQTSLESISPQLLLALRFALTGLLLALLRPQDVRQLPALLIPALPLSLSLFAGFALQTEGLLTTTPARSSFLTSLSVVLVPLVELVRSRRPPRAELLGAVALASAGVWVLFLPLRLEWHRGDTLSILGAVSFGFYVVELGRMSRRHSAGALVLAQSVTIALVAGSFAFLVETPRFIPSAGVVVALAYLSLVCTVVTFLLMTWAQARVEPIEAGVIYTLEPVLAAAFSICLGREAPSYKIAAGGALILGAMLISGLGPRESPPAPVEGID